MISLPRPTHGAIAPIVSALAKKLPKPILVEVGDEAARIQAMCPDLKIISPETLLHELRDTLLLAIDTETTGLPRTKGVKQEASVVVFWSLSDGINRWCLSRAVLPHFKKFLEDPNRSFIFHNVNFDRWMLLNSGVDFANGGRTNFRCFDTQVMHAIRFDNQPHGLKECMLSMFGLEMVSFRKTFNSAETDIGKKLRGFYQTDPYKVIAYASLDAWATYQLFFELIDELAAFPSAFGTLMDYYVELEQPMHDVLWHMERRGTLLDCDRAIATIDELDKQRNEFRKKIAHLVGRVINPDSNPQIIGLFYKKVGGVWLDDKGEKPKKLTDGGESGNKQPSIDEEVLAERAKGGCEISKLLLEFRYLGKMGSYIKQYLKLSDDEGRIHTSYYQHTASTGRLSSREPNLENVPKDDDTFEIRKLFIAPPGYVIGDSDYGQLEMRIAASEADETKMLVPIQEGRDMHSWTAHLMFQVPYEDIIDAINRKDTNQELNEYHKKLLKLRGKAKVINFEVLYGATAYKLSTELGISVEEADDILTLYWEAYPNLLSYFDGVKNFCDEHYYVITCFGRIRQIAQVKSEFYSRKDYNKGMRAAGNHPIQGHAAEITKAAQIRIFFDRWFWEQGVRMVNQVHDEIVLEVPEHLQHDVEFVDRYERYMTHPFGDHTQPLRVPLKADISFGSSWGHAH